MADHAAATTDGDGGWKQFIQVKGMTEQFLQFYFPKVHREIDFGVPIEHLEQEFQGLFPDSETGGRTVDKVLRVRWKGRGETLLLIHIEIQGQRRSNFAERMFTYYYRLVDRYRRPVTSLALLVDSQPRFRPSTFVHEAPGTRMTFEFSTVKLLDFKTEAELLADPSPFALVSLIQLRKLQAGTDANRIFVEKRELAREVFRRGYSAKQARHLFRFLDYIMKLPPELEQTLKQKLVQKGQDTMTYISSIERFAMEEGIAKGEAGVLLRLIERKFGEVTDETRQRIKDADSPQVLLWAERILTAETIEELFQ